MDNQLINRKESCTWLDKKICKIPEDQKCSDDCSLGDLKFNKENIIERMQFEEKEIQRLKKDGLFKNRNTIKDLVMGIVIMQRTLNEHFHHIELKIVDKDIEKSYGFLKKFRK